MLPSDRYNYNVIVQLSIQFGIDWSASNQSEASISVAVLLENNYRFLSRSIQDESEKIKITRS